MKAELFGSLPLVACSLTLVALGLLLAAWSLKLAACSLTLGPQNEALTILRVECSDIHAEVIGNKFLSAGHMLHSRLKAANRTCSHRMRCLASAPGTVCW